MREKINEIFADVINETGRKNDFFKTTPFCQAQILLEDIFLYSDYMSYKSRKFVQGTLLHCQRVHRWVLKLKPDASDALQIASLAHDIDRAFPGREVRQEAYHNYDEYKKQHAIQSARIIGDLLRKAKFKCSIIKEVEELVKKHEVGGDPETEILKAADSLTFFQYDTDTYLKRSGPRATKDKMAFMYNRLSSEYKILINKIQFRNPVIKKLFEEVKGSK